MTLQPRCVALAALGLAACAAAPPVTPVPMAIESIEAALRQGRIEQAADEAARLRAREPEDADAAQWNSVVADLLWRDQQAVEEQLAAIRIARRRGGGNDAELRGRLGDLLFQAGRWGEAAGPLEIGAIGAQQQQQRRAALAAVAQSLPFVRKQTGPLLTEQRLLAGDAPEFVCGSGDLQRPFAIDTGTSMTTLSNAFAAELGLRGRRPAGTALDGAGRALPVDVGVLPRFVVGDVDLGAVPMLVVDDLALTLRDLHGGPEHSPRGILGLDLLTAFRITLDPERGSVVFELPRGLRENESVQCVRADGRCLMPVTIDGARMWFVLDTGASHSSLTAVGAAALPGGEARAVASFRRVRTVGGALIAVREVRDLVLRASAARFTGVTLPVVPREAGGLFPVHGVLGVDLLSRCLVTLDRGRARLQGMR